MTLQERVTVALQGVGQDVKAARLRLDALEAAGRGVDLSQVLSVAAGSTLGLEQQLLAQAGQPARTVRAVAYTTTDRTQGVSLGPNNMVVCYASGADYNAGNVLHREFLADGEPIVLPSLPPGAIITSTAGFDGASEQINGSAESPMPLMSYGLSFRESFAFAFRSSGVYAPGTTANGQGWVHVVNGPLPSVAEFAFGSGTVVRGQTGVELAPWQYHRFYTQGANEYLLRSTNPVMAAIQADMSEGGGKFVDSRHWMPLAGEIVGWPREGFISSLFQSVCDWWVRDGASGRFNSGNPFGPGTPIDTDAAPPVGTGANDWQYRPDGFSRYAGPGLFSALSGADGAGVEATAFLPTSAMSTKVAQPFFILDALDGARSGMSLGSLYEGTAKYMEWDAAQGRVVERFNVNLTRKIGEPTTTAAHQQFPCSASVSGSVADNVIPMGGDVAPGYWLATVPIVLISQNASANHTPPLRSVNGTTAAAIVCDDDETLCLGHTPPEHTPELRVGSDGLTYRRVIGSGGSESWVVG